MSLAVDPKAVVGAWLPYLKQMGSWQDVVKGVEPKPTGCGPVYELANPLDRPNESFAIVDMRELKAAEPHYHIHDETEIYVVLEGRGTVVVGHKEQEVEAGSVVVTPPNTVHFTIPRGGLVLVAINTPPFNPDNYVAVSQSNAAVGFDQAQFERLSHE